MYCALDMLFASSQNKHPMSREKGIGAQIGDLVDIASVLVETTALQVREPQATAVKQNITREKATPLGILEQQTSRIRSVPARADRTQRNPVQRNLLSVGEQFVWTTWVCNETSGIPTKFEVESNRAIAIDILHRLLGASRRP